jgi:hypothetical protein
MILGRKVHESYYQHQTNRSRARQHNLHVAAQVQGEVEMARSMRGSYGIDGEFAGSVTLKRGRKCGDRQQQRDA